MFCKRCGSQNDNDALHCVNCGSPIGAFVPPAGAPQTPPQPPVQQQYNPQFNPPPPPPPVGQQFNPQYGGSSPYGAQSFPVPAPNTRIESYLTQAILVTLFCCLPLGIVAIIKSRDVDKFVASGNIAAAMDASKSTKTLVLVGFISGLVIVVVYGVIAVVSTANLR